MDFAAVSYSVSCSDAVSYSEGIVGISETDLMEGDIAVSYAVDGSESCGSSSRGVSVEGNGVLVPDLVQLSLV